MRNKLLLLILFMGVHVLNCLGQVYKTSENFKHHVYLKKLHSEEKYDSVLIYMYDNEGLLTDCGTECTILLGDALHFLGRHFDSYAIFGGLQAKEKLTDKQLKHIKKLQKSEKKIYKQIQKDLDRLKQGNVDQDLNEVKKTFNHFFMEYQNSGVASTLALKFFLSFGDYDKLLIWFRRHLKVAPKDTRVIKQVVDHIGKLDMPALNEAFVKELENTVPRLYHREKFYANFDSEDFDKTLMHFEKMFKDTFGSHFAVRKAQLLFDKNYRERALAYLSTRDQDDFKIKKKMAFLHYKMKDYHKSSSLYKALISQDSTSAYFHGKYASCIGHIASEKRDEEGYLNAAEYFVKASQLAPNEPSHYFNAGLYYSFCHQPELAIEFSRKAVDLVVSDKEQFANYDLYEYVDHAATCWKKKKDQAKVYKAFIPELKSKFIKEGSAENAHDLGMAIKNSILGDSRFNKYTDSVSLEAVKYLKLAIGMDSSEVSYYNDLDDVYFSNFGDEDQYEKERINLAKTQVRQHPTNMDGYATLFFIHFHNKNYKEADKWYVAANKVDHPTGKKYLRNNINVSVSTIRKFKWTKVKERSGR